MFKILLLLALKNAVELLMYTSETVKYIHRKPNDAGWVTLNEARKKFLKYIIIIILVIKQASNLNTSMFHLFLCLADILKILLVYIHRI